MVANCTGIFSPVNTWEKVPVAAWDDLGYSVYVLLWGIYKIQILKAKEFFSFVICVALCPA